MTTLVTGGAASGKSEYAEHLAETAHAAGRETPLWYIATMTAPDDESRDRVQKHRDRRAGKGYETVECPDGDALAAFAERLEAEAGSGRTAQCKIKKPLNAACVWTVPERADKEIKALK